MRRRWIQAAIVTLLSVFPTVTMPVARGDDNQLSSREVAEGWELLFDGKTTKGWMTPKHEPLPASHVQDGALNPHPTNYMLVLEKPRDSFQLALDFKLSKGCNSGVFFRTAPLEPRPPKDLGYNGLEVALDDTRTAGNHDTGAIYDLQPPARNAMKPAGEWNHLLLTVDGPRVRVEVNGEVVNELNLDDYPKPFTRPDGTRHKFDIAYKDHPRLGYIGLQDHGGDCWFKNIRLRDLGK